MTYFLKDALERAIKTFFEAFITTFCMAAIVEAMPWMSVVIISIGSALLSLLSSVCCKYATGNDSASLIKRTGEKAR